MIFLFQYWIENIIFVSMDSTFFESELLLFYAILLLGLITRPWSKKRKSESGNLTIIGVIGWSLIVFSALLIITAFDSNISGIIFLGMVILVVLWIIYELIRFLVKRIPKWISTRTELQRTNNYHHEIRSKFFPVTCITLSIKFIVRSKYIDIEWQRISNA